MRKLEYPTGKLG
jgi:hypothetical protein